jgi:hypothetical protein
MVKGSYSGPPMTLGNAASACVRLIVRCRDCGHQVETEPAEMARQYGPEIGVLDWCKRLVCSVSGSRDTNMVVAGTDRC